MGADNCVRNIELDFNTINETLEDHLQTMCFEAKWVYIWIMPEGDW